MWPRPAATAIGLCETIQIFFREPVHFHREAHRRVHGSNAAPLEGGDDPPRDVVHLVAGVMELEVRERAERAAHVLSVHPADEAEQRPRLRQEGADVLALRGDLGAVDADEADVVRSARERDLTEPRRVQTRRLGGTGDRFFAMAFHRRVLGKSAHLGSFCCTCN